MIGRLQILILLFTLIGCADQGSTPVSPTEPTTPPIEGNGSLGPGVIAVFFSEGTTPAQAEQFLKDLNVTFEFPPSGSPLYVVVRVPIDSVEQWVEKLKTYPIVKSARPLAATWTS